MVLVSGRLLGWLFFIQKVSFTSAPQILHSETQARSSDDRWQKHKSTSQTTQAGFKPLIRDTHVILTYMALVKANHIDKPEAGVEGEYITPQEPGTAKANGKS